MLPELTALAQEIEADIVGRYRTPGTAVALGALTGARRWRSALRKLAIGAPAGSRLIVDALSEDYLTAVLAASGETQGRRLRNVRRLRGAVTPGTLVSAADAAGLAIVTVAPYGLLLGGPEPALSHLASLESTHRWRRTLSWLPEDAGLTELVLLVERALVSALPTALTLRMMVVLEKRDDPAGNHAWLRRQSEAAAAWDAGRAASGAILSEDVKAELDRLLAPAHARYLGFALLDVAQQRLPWLDARTVLPEARAEQYAEWRRALSIDEVATRFMREWPRGCQPRFRRGVDTTLAVDYQLVADLLERHLGVFGEAH